MRAMDRFSKMNAYSQAWSRITNIFTVTIIPMMVLQPIVAVVMSVFWMIVTTAFFRWRSKEQHSALLQKIQEDVGDGFMTPEHAERVTAVINLINS